VEAGQLKIPNHLAIIMDGNGRWAESRGLPRTSGHEEGAESVREIVRASRKLGVKYLTLYSFSTENWKRPRDEVSALMNLLKKYVLEEREEILGNGIRLNAIGQLDRLPPYVRLPLKGLMLDSKRNNSMVLNLALSYGSRAEIVNAIQTMATHVRARRYKPEDITEEMVSSYLFTAGMPDPDLMIRTSGEMRLSNFLLWQCAYSELYVSELSWPEFRRPELEEAFRDYASRERRYGKTGKQIRESKH
jgi:undecaprenyl diphosphate synthase